LGDFDGVADGLAVAVGVADFEGVGEPPPPGRHRGDPTTGAHVAPPPVALAVGDALDFTVDVALVLAVGVVDAATPTGAVCP
jgi:hypothetical protein